MSRLLSVSALALIATSCIFVRTVIADPTPTDGHERWTEVTAPHFKVMSNEGEETARRIADQFERIRLIYSKALSPDLRLNPGVPIVIFAVKNEKSLSQLIPEYWAEKGHTHPAGLFVPNADKNFIALRTDVEGEFPYIAVYHEYVHLIENLNFQHMPLWLSEGYAMFLGSATLTPHGGKLAQPNDAELKVLRETKLLPFNVLFRVGHDSPYYNEAEKTNVFYAQSWALVHYLMADQNGRRAGELARYIVLTEQGADPVGAATDAFGDLSQLERELRGYIFGSSFSMLGVDLPETVNPRAWSMRVMPPAEIQATLAQFDMCRDQLDAARWKIEEALQLDPNDPAAQESKGLFLFKENRHEEAQPYFARAVALHSNDALAYYYDGMLLVSGEVEEDPDAAQAALEKAVALRPELAPAWDALAQLYVDDPDTLGRALAAAERAVKAMPGEPHYRFNLAVVLVHIKNFERARELARGVEVSGDADLTDSARQLEHEIDLAEEEQKAGANSIRTERPPDTPAAQPH